MVGVAVVVVVVVVVVVAVAVVVKTMALRDAYQLLHDGALSLAKVERYGIHIDESRLQRTISKCEAKIRTLQDELRQDTIYTTWRCIYGDKANLGSRPQLAHVLFNVLKFRHKGYTARSEQEEDESKRRYRTDESVFEDIDLPFVKKLLEVESLKKLKSTQLEGIRRETINGYCHPMFNLNTVDTYRSSADRPNIQNQHRRDPLFAKLLRRCFVPSPGNVLVEIDFKALEFAIAACFWEDKEMIAYASDPKKDIHRDMAAAIYCVKPSDVSKGMRDIAKNQFVFPSLYGSYYVNTCHNLWESIARHKLASESGVPAGEILEKHGIKELGRCNPKDKPLAGTFEEHVKQVEDDEFLGRFQTFAKRKDKWFEEYRRTGSIELVTGFRMGGVMTRNKCMNSPIQGPAFHCLLWSMNRIMAKLRLKRMKSRIIAEIHDSILGDIPRLELQSYLTIATNIMTRALPKSWQWIVVPLTVAVEVGEKNWFDKVPWICGKDGVWQPK